MKTTTTFQSSDPEWCDVVMRTLPVMFRRGQVNGLDDSVFVYASTFYSVQEEVRRGASHEAIRHQRNRILQSIDAAPSSDYEKEQFAGPFARGRRRAVRTIPLRPSSGSLGRGSSRLLADPIA